MTERLQDLVGQAKVMAEETINKKISKNVELDAFAEKFAKLVIDECCMWIKQNGGIAFDEDVAALHKHFGGGL